MSNRTRSTQVNGNGAGWNSTMGPLIPIWDDAPALVPDIAPDIKKYIQ